MVNALKVLWKKWVIANNSKLKSNVKNFVENEILKVF